MARLDLPAEAGTYLLVVRLGSKRTFRAGSLGRVTLRAGAYLYAGSARGPGGLGARVGRHLGGGAGAKRLRWHIDYLLALPGARVVAVACTRGAGGRAGVRTGAGECGIIRRALDRFGGTVPVPGFGSSDCRRGCSAHLLEMPVRWGRRVNRCSPGPSTASG